MLTAACPEFTADCINSHFSSASTASRDMGKGVLVRPSVPRRGEEGGRAFSENVCFRPVGRRRQSKKFSLPIRASLALSRSMCVSLACGAFCAGKSRLHVLPPPLPSPCIRSRMRRAYGRWTFKREMQQESGRFPKIPFESRFPKIPLKQKKDYLKKGLKLLASVASAFFLKYLPCIA